jgi:general L-amino acid transport system permease protein
MRLLETRRRLRLLTQAPFRDFISRYVGHMRLLETRRSRELLIQALFLGIVGACVAYIVNNVGSSLREQGISSGFGFLQNPAGFTVNMSLIPFNEQSSYGRAFIVSISNTFIVSILAILLSTILGFIIGIASVSSNWIISRYTVAYVEIFRNIPLLLQVFFWYFAVLRALPSPRESASLFDSIFLNNRGLFIPAPLIETGAFFHIFGAILLAYLFFRWVRRLLVIKRITYATAISAAVFIFVLLLTVWAIQERIFRGWDFPDQARFGIRGGLTLIPEFLALLVGLVMYTSAYVAEIVRGGIEAVPKGQSEASHALGLSPRQSMRYVILPQSFLTIIPPLSSQYLTLVKGSSVGAAIAYPEVVSVFSGTVLSQTGQAIEIVFLTMAVFLLSSAAISFTMNLVNWRVLSRTKPLTSVA